LIDLPRHIKKKKNVFFEMLTFLAISQLFMMAMASSEPIVSTCSCLCQAADNSTSTRSFTLPCGKEAPKCADRCVPDPRGCANGTTLLESVHTCGFQCGSFNASVEAHGCVVAALNGTDSSPCRQLDQSFRCATKSKCVVSDGLASQCSSTCLGVANAVCVTASTKAQSCTSQASCDACRSFSSSCLWCDYNAAGGRCFDTNTCPSVNALPLASSFKPNHFTCDGVSLTATMSMLVAIQIILSIAQ
jgi:hypothetical protein